MTGNMVKRGPECTIGLNAMLSATLALVGAFGLCGEGVAVEPVSARIFGQNIEHTRAGVVHGLSAECVKNRKFAGRPSPEGVAWGWEAFGTKALCDMLSAPGFTHHAPKTCIRRFHEINSQKVTSLLKNGCAGISQTVSLRAVGYRFVAHVRGCFERESVSWRVRFVTSDGIELACRRLAVTGTGWREMSFDFVSTQATTVRLEIGVEGVASGVVGAVSLLPSDHFHGMRRDVVECLKEIGTSVIRWPGGCFAGDYRWRDGLLPRDERAPLQSFMPSTQVYTESFDDNDIGTEEILALCAELNAEPFFTLNPVWDKPEDSADWLRHCRGRVKRWSVGNELYSPAMEGTVDPDGYVRLARAHADAMLKVDPTVTLAGLGAYESRDRQAAWAEGAARSLADILPLASVHQYINPKVPDYSSPARIAETVTRTLAAADEVCGELHRVRALLPENVSMSHDEWNIWCVWYRQDAPVNGVCVLHYLHRLMRDQTALKLDNACYFQATEGAVRFTPQTAWLSSVGEAFRLAKAHVGGCPLSGLSQEVFATEHADGRGEATFYNPSTADFRVFRLPWKTGRVARTEQVSYASPLPGTRGVRGEAACGEADGWRTITLPPLAIAKVTVLRETAGD